ENDLLAVGREERPAIVAAGRVRQLADILAVRVHNMQFQIVLAGAVGAENNLFAVGGVRTFGVVAGGMGQVLQAGAVGLGLENIHERIKVPDVFPLFLGLLFLGPQFVFLAVMLFRVRVEMAAGENHLCLLRMKIGAGAFAPS